MSNRKKLKQSNGFLNWIIKRFEDLKLWKWIIYCAILFLVGRFIDIRTQGAFPHFLEHQLLLITATTLLVIAMRSFFTDIEKLSSKSEGLLAKNPAVDSIYKEKLLPLQRSPWILVACIVVTVFFFTCIVLLEYIEIDIIGIYALYIAGSSVLIGVYGYMQYLYFLWFVHAAGESDYSYSNRRQAYNYYAPAETKWIAQIARTSQRLRNYFLFIGFIYVVEYGMLVPANRITLCEDSVLLDMPNNAAFVLSWIALFILVIIAFPVINYIQRSLVTRLVEKLKSATINELSELMESEYSNSKKKSASERLQTTITYEILITNVKNSKSYPINRQLSYETIMTIVTFCVHVFNFYDKISSVSLIGGLLP